MSTADLFVDGFPHGTPAGYAEGCKSGACPAKEEFGMSCRMAWQAERSDRRYRRLADEGMPPAGIALELGIVEREQLSPAAAVALAAWRAGMQPVPVEAVETTPEPEPEPVQLPTPRVAQTDTSRPARIRAWARERGYSVGETGPVRRAVLDAYTAWEAAGSPGPVSSPPESTTGADVPVPEHTKHPGPADEFVAPPAPPTPVPHSGIGNPANVRPDFGQAMVDVDVERARRIAVHLEQLLAKAEEDRDDALAEVHTITAALAREQRIAASAEAEAAALRRALADDRRARRGLGAWVRRVVAR